MRKAIKFLHTFASCGLIGALLGYVVILVWGPHETATAYAEARRAISALCDYLLLPSLAVALVSGLLSMAAHRAFLDTRWAWLKALLGLSMFEATLGFIQSKATSAAALSMRVAAGDEERSALAEVLANEWMSLCVILALSAAQVALGIWRPRLATRK